MKKISSAVLALLLSSPSFAGTVQTPPAQGDQPTKPGQTGQTTPAQGDQTSTPGQTAQTLPPAQGDQTSTPGQTTQIPPAQGNKPSAPSQTTQTPPAQGDKPSVPSQTTQTPPAQGDKPSAPSQTTQTPPAQGDKPSAPGQTGQQAGDAATTITYDSTRTDSIAFHAIQLANAALLKISERALFHHVSHDVRSAAKATVKNRLKVSVALPPLAAKVDEVNLVGIPNALDAFKASIHNDYEAVEDSSRSSFEENYVAARNDINRSLVAILVELRTSGFYDGEIAEFVNKNIELSSYESGL